MYATISYIKMDEVSLTEQFRILCKATVTQKHNFKLWSDNFLLPMFSNHIVLL